MSAAADTSGTTKWMTQSGCRFLGYLLVGPEGSIVLPSGLSSEFVAISELPTQERMPSMPPRQPLFVQRCCKHDCSQETCCDPVGLKLGLAVCHHTWVKRSRENFSVLPIPSSKPEQSRHLWYVTVLTVLPLRNPTLRNNVLGDQGRPLPK